MLALAKFGEIVLNNSAGNFIEKVSKNLKQRRKKNNPATYESGGRVIFTDSELEFHPRSFEKKVVTCYNLALKNLGILSLGEKDSGLKS